MTPDSITYKPSGIDWLGDIPSHWEVRRLKFCVKLNAHKEIGTAEGKRFKIALENIESWTGRFIETETFEFEGEGNYFKKGDVLLNKLRPYLAKVYKAEQDGISVGELLVLTPNSEVILQDFLFHRLISADFINLIDSSTYGAKMPRANWDFIGNIPIAIPPIDEQCLIVSHINRKLTDINNFLSQKQRFIDLLREQKQAIINEAVTKGIYPQHNDNHLV